MHYKFVLFPELIYLVMNTDGVENTSLAFFLSTKENLTNLNIQILWL